MFFVRRVVLGHHLGDALRRRCGAHLGEHRVDARFVFRLVLLVAERLAHLCFVLHLRGLDVGVEVLDVGLGFVKGRLSLQRHGVERPLSHLVDHRRVSALRERDLVRRHQADRDRANRFSPPLAREQLLDDGVVLVGPLHLHLAPRLDHARDDLHRGE